MDKLFNLKITCRLFIHLTFKWQSMNSQFVLSGWSFTHHCCFSTRSIWLSFIPMSIIPYHLCKLNPILRLHVWPHGATQNYWLPGPCSEWTSFKSSGLCNRRKLAHVRFPPPLRASVRVWASNFGSSRPMFRINFPAESDLQQDTLTLSVFGKFSLEKKERCALLPPCGFILYYTHTLWTLTHCWKDAKTVHASRCKTILLHKNPRVICVFLLHF